MRSTRWIVGACLLAMLAGCNRDTHRGAAEPGSAYESGGTGGAGSGPTGTGGSEPADNPAAGSRAGNGTGGP